MSETFIHTSSFIDNPCSIGKNVHIWHYTHVMPHAEIGDNCILGQNVFIGSYVKLGKNVKVQNNVSLYEGVVCEDYVFIGPSAVFTNVINPRSAIPRKHELKPTIIRKGVTIGANATIVCGIEIGEYAFIAAGTVVLQNVLPYALMAGNPAKRMGWMSEHGHRLIFDEWGLAVCPQSKQTYKLKKGKVEKL